MKRVLVVMGAFLLVFGARGIAGAIQVPSPDVGSMPAIEGDRVDPGQYIPVGDMAGSGMGLGQGNPGMGLGQGNPGMGLGQGNPGMGFGQGNPGVGPGPGGNEGAPVPEPATMLLLSVGLMGLAGVARKKAHRS